MEILLCSLFVTFWKVAAPAKLTIKHIRQFFLRKVFYFGSRSFSFSLIFKFWYFFIRITTYLRLSKQSSDVWL